jgi:hypothetical protein
MMDGTREYDRVVLGNAITRKHINKMQTCHFRVSQNSHNAETGLRDDALIGVSFLLNRN